ncbi:MAG: Maf family protein, partial [Caldimonas sp.]
MKASTRAGAPFVYLASQSPRRRELLAQIGVRHELLLPGPDEDAEALEALIAGELPDAYVGRVTLAKLAAARRRRAARALPEVATLRQCARTCSPGSIPRSQAPVPGK